MHVYMYMYVFICTSMIRLCLYPRMYIYIYTNVVIYVFVSNAVGALLIVPCAGLLFCNGCVPLSEASTRWRNSNICCSVCSA